MEKYDKRTPNSKVLDEQKENKVLVKAVVDSIRLFLRQGWACDGIIEFETVEDVWGNKIDTVGEFGMIKSDRSRFVELVKLLGQFNKTVEDALMEDLSKNNQKLTSRAVQREIVRICAKETMNSILTEVDDSKFTLVLDSWTGITWHKNISLVVRFVNKSGAVVERFLGIVHVPEEDTDASSLIKVTEKYLREVGIHLEKLRCYAYNGSSFLCELLSKQVFLEEHKRAYSINCLSQLAAVTVTKYNCETNEQFNQPNVNFILCVAAMDPMDSFSSFNKYEMVRFAKYFSCDFSPEEIDMLDKELDKYIVDMRSSPDFKDLDGIVKLAEKLVEMQWAQQYPLVYRVIELALTLPTVAPAIERVVSSGKVVQEWINKRVGNEWLNDCLVIYIEQDVFNARENEVIMNRFESSTECRPT